MDLLGYLLVIPLWLVVLLTLSITLAVVRRINLLSTNFGKDELNRGQAAPDFTASSLSGETIGLTHYRGRTVAFVFIGTSCEPCHEALASFEILGRKARQAGVELVLVSTDSLEATKDFVTTFNVTLPILVAPHPANTFFKDYKAEGTPYYCLIDDKGKVISVGYPSLEWGGWKALAEAWEAVAKKAPTPTSGIVSSNFQHP